MTNLKNKLLSTQCFIDNEWLDKYCNLINNYNVLSEHKNTQIHHILPRFYYSKLGLEIDNSTKNTIELVIKDHIFVHYLLCKCTKGELLKSNISAFNLMIKNDKYKNFSEKEVIDLIDNIEIKPNVTSIPVICIETNKKYESAREAWKDTGIDWSSISKCCKGRRKTAGGHHWKFYEDFINNIEKEYIGNYKTKIKQNNEVQWKKIPVICLETKKEYSCIAEASKDTGISSSCISDVINGKYYTAGKYHWQKLEDYNNNIKIDTNKSKSKKVLCVETNVIYNSTKEAAESINKNKNSIARVCRGERITCGGYHWKYL